MDLMKLLRSLEEFVFEAIALLFFYPKTLLRITFRPLQSMEYAEREEADDKTDAYDEAVSPPLLLLITLSIANAVAVALHEPPAAAASPVAKALLDSPQNLLMFRSLLFSVIPLTAAVWVLRRNGRATTRTTLRQPFFAQCYLTSPFAMVVSLAGIAAQTAGPAGRVAGSAACALAFAWMVGVQAAWFRQKLGVGRINAAGMALALLAWACFCVLGIAALVVLY